jgi:hypothetical protein
MHSHGYAATNTFDKWAHGLRWVKTQDTGSSRFVHCTPGGLDA